MSSPFYHQTTITDFRNQLERFLSNDKPELNPTQAKLSIPLVFRIYKKMSAGLTNFDAIKLAEDIIIDGHHRYVASRMASIEIEKFPATRNHNQVIYDWSQVELITNEYDSASQINYHNFNDAQRNGVSIQDVERILSE